MLPTFVSFLLLVLLPFVVSEHEVDLQVLLDVGPNLGIAIPRKIKKHLSPWLASEGSYKGYSMLSLVKRVIDKHHVKNESPLLLLSLGNTETYSTLLASFKDIKNKIEEGRSPESFHIISLQYGSVFILAGNGEPIEKCWNASTAINTGAAYASYEILQALGLAFWNPLEAPIRPKTLSVESFPRESPFVKVESPHWRSRAFHLHTQHPLELTDVLQGFDIPLSMERPAEEARSEVERISHELLGEEEDDDDLETCPLPEGNKSRAHDGYVEHWEDMLPDVERFFEWCVAHRLNRVEWILLGNRRWGSIVSSPLRQERLQLLARLGQAMGLMVGVDDPIAFQQQHSWVMTTTLGPVARQLQAVRDRVDWILAAGFDFLSTESGLSEFSHPNDQLMLSLLNEFAEHVNGTWGKEALVKVHCSTKQTCTHYMDPRTGDPLNFNFLPTYASSKLGVLPHTVQAYALDDPTAGVYGNQNFSVMKDYILWEASLKNRSIHFYPETAYFVNVDIDVPLFLPLYAERRIHDLHLLASEEKKGDFRLAGNLNFDSGWEWGYWLNDAIMAAASWDPQQWRLHAPVEVEEGRQSLGFFREACSFALRALEADVRERIVDWLVRLVRFEYETLLLGEIEGQPCPNQKKLSGIAYLCGRDTWVELPRRLGLSFTQPNFVAYYDHADEDYPYVHRLLAHMKEQTSSFHQEIQDILKNSSFPDNKQQHHRVPPAMWTHLEELEHAMSLLSLRAHQVFLLYSSTAPGVQAEERQDLLQQSRRILEEATRVVRRQEGHYQAPLGRIANWRENPTVYHFDYLWTVHSLYYWWRDQGQVEGGSYLAAYSACYLNRMDPTEVALGFGKTLLRKLRYFVSWVFPFTHLWVDCLAPPQQAYEFPRDL